MARSPGLQIDAGVPDLPDRVHRRGDRARERFETVKFAESECGQCRLNDLAQSLIIDRAHKTARDSSRKLLQGENVQSVLALTRGGQAPLAHGMTAMGNHSVTVQASPLPPLQRPTSMVTAQPHGDMPDRHLPWSPH